MESNRDNMKGGKGATSSDKGAHANGTGLVRFHPGTMAITRGAMSVLVPEDAAKGMGRHLRGDWGDVGKADWQSNDDALKHGLRLLSSYQDRKGTKFWIITEHDRSLTTVLLPEEY